MPLATSRHLKIGVTNLDPQYMIFALSTSMLENRENQELDSWIKNEGTYRPCEFEKLCPIYYIFGN